MRYIIKLYQFYHLAKKGAKDMARRATVEMAVITIQILRCFLVKLI